MITITKALDDYLETTALARAENTARCYGNGVKAFRRALLANNVDPDTTDVKDLSEAAIVWLITSLNNLEPSTERNYTTAISNFFGYLVAEEIASPNLERLRLLKQRRGRRLGERIPEFSKPDVEAVISYAGGLGKGAYPPGLRGYRQELRDLRDRALILTLADTGLRIHEACNLLVDQIDFELQRAVIIGKGNKQAVVRFSRRSLEAIREYLEARAPLDALQARISRGKGKAKSAAVFLRHDRGSAIIAPKMTTRTGQDTVIRMVAAALGEGKKGSVTPHSFRHYFITEILDKSDNLMLAKELARHSNVNTTAKYAHLSSRELDQKYSAIFEGER